MPELGILAWAALALGAAVVGMSKAALPGVNTIAIALFAAALPAKQSTGALLVLLIVGDVFALLIHRRHARLRALLPLIPAVIVGILLGTAFLAFADNTWTKRVIGIILLLVIAVTLWRRRTERRGDTRPPGGRMMGVSYGALGGFTTMVANAGGPVMSMYFYAMRMPVLTFLGTSAWFFAIVNVIKLPFSAGLGLITRDTLVMDLMLVPLVLIGAYCGAKIARRIPQGVFEKLILVLTVVSALALLVL